MQGALAKARSGGCASKMVLDRPASPAGSASARFRLPGARDLMMMASVAVPIEALAMLRRRLAALPGRHPRRELLRSLTAERFAVSRATLPATAR